ncbi:MAG: SPFH domain-containing protein [Bacteroidales bacterium]|nr:SPFH domain-containing protein [Bacteroidales bacterium]MBD5235941.1 SPFH domain-containing protein [Bacteroidales bacterium]MBD5237841.1 SPFH domain-containing protein [Bacteroidales bacterium]
MEENQNHEYEYRGPIINGFLMIFFTFILIPVLFIITILYANDYNIGLSIAISIPLFILFILGLVGYFIQEPNVARVMIFFGKYKGTCRKVGYFWMNPFMTRKKLSLRIRNMDIDPIKVNDKIGNPVLIGMVLVWKIRDTYRVVFDLDSESFGGTTGSISNRALDAFVRIQSDAALREVTGHFAYDQTDSGDPDELTLRDSGNEISDLLEKKINERLAMAGIEVVEARINYLAYAPEIAAVMLRRQQASAIITAREKIVEGAVSMVEMALKTLDEKQVVTLSNEQKASMVGNLLAVLCADEPLTPTINASA